MHILVSIRKGRRLTALTGLAIVAMLAAGCGYGGDDVVEVAELSATQPAVSGLPKPNFNDAGLLEQPTRYREWIFIGTPLTPNTLNPPEAPFPEFHTVYIHPDDYVYWRQTGTFRDGTVLVKELITVGETEASSGNGFFMGEFRGLEAAVKDSGRFPDEPGNWAYFSYGHSYPLAQATAAQETESCNACHQTSAAYDYVFTQYYPILSSSRGDMR